MCLIRVGAKLYRTALGDPCFKGFGSIAMTHLLTVICCHLLVVLISHFDFFYFIHVLDHFKYQNIISAFVIRLNALMSCIKQRVNTSKCHFRFCVDFICLVTEQPKLMFYYSSSLIKCKNLTQKIMDSFRKKGFIMMKMPINFFNLLETIHFYQCE